MFSRESFLTSISVDTDAKRKTVRKAAILALILVAALVAALVTANRSKKPEIKEDWTIYADPAVPGDTTVSYECSRGMYRKEPQGCLYCPAGSYCLGGPDMPMAIPCKVGFYQPKRGKDSCTPSQEGYFVGAINSTMETPCLAGSYQPLPKQGACLPARVGHKVPMEGSYKDFACPPNTYQNMTGKNDCIPCGQGQHQPFVGQASCMANVAIPWASLVPFTSFATLDSAVQNHGCPDGLYSDLGAPELYSMIELNPCEITQTSISISFYGGSGQSIGTNKLTVNATGIDCSGTRVQWGAPPPPPRRRLVSTNDPTRHPTISPSTSPIFMLPPTPHPTTNPTTNPTSPPSTPSPTLKPTKIPTLSPTKAPITPLINCAALANFGSLKLIYETGSAGRTFQTMKMRQATIVEAMTAGYAPPIQISFADGRLVELNTNQLVATVGGTSHYRLARYYADSAGNQFYLEINGLDACTYCETNFSPCQTKSSGQTINVHIFSPSTSFRCGDDVFVRLPFSQP